MTQPQPGWYPDPTDRSRERLWDGERWTENTRLRPVDMPAPLSGAPAPLRGVTPPPPPPPFSPSGSGTKSEALLDPNFGEAIAEAFKNFVNFEGRASRRSYWLFWLFWLFSFLVGFVEGLFIGSSISFLVLFLPSLAVAVRRLHDTGRSGLWVVVPFVNLVFFALRGHDGPNRFGAAPRPRA